MTPVQRITIGLKNKELHEFCLGWQMLAAAWGRLETGELR